MSLLLILIGGGGNICTNQNNLLHKHRKYVPHFALLQVEAVQNPPGWTLIGAALLQGAPGVLDAKEKYFPGLQHSWSFEKSGFDSQEGVSVTAFHYGGPLLF